MSFRFNRFYIYLDHSVGMNRQNISVYLQCKIQNKQAILGSVLADGVFDLPNYLPLIFFSKMQKWQEKLKKRQESKLQN